MLRRTSTKAIFLWSMGPAKQCGVPNNDNMDELIMYVKQAKKLRQYFGSHFQRIPDREFYYGLFGGPRGGRFTIRRAHNRKQFVHHNATYGRYAIHHTNPTNPWSGIGSGGAFREIFSNQVSGTNSWWDVTFKMHANDLSKNKAIEWMEGWGVKYKVLDEVTQPRMEDMSYVKHSLYSHNFPWIRDPITNGVYGDADYWWKGDAKFDYEKHGAATKSVANEFRSLWGVKDSFYAPEPVIESADRASKQKSSSNASKDAKSSDKKSASKSDDKKDVKKDDSKKSAKQEEPKKAEADKKEAKVDLKKPADKGPSPIADKETATRVEQPKDSKTSLDDRIDARPTGQADPAKPREANPMSQNEKIEPKPTVAAATGTAPREVSGKTTIEDKAGKTTTATGDKKREGSDPDKPSNVSGA